MSDRVRPRAAAAPPDRDETWEALGGSTGTVTSLIHRGLTQLKDVIEP
ncbi:MAG TPA: hypothetical protein VKB57_27425 [Acidimicrobiales bacterium]|nr:hypothetical protein [Acidimicrobiales bacterium]